MGTALLRLALVVVVALTASPSMLLGASHRESKAAATPAASVGLADALRAQLAILGLRAACLLRLDAKCAGAAEPLGSQEVHVWTPGKRPEAGCTPDPGGLCVTVVHGEPKSPR